MIVYGNYINESNNDLLNTNQNINIDINDHINNLKNTIKMINNWTTSTYVQRIKKYYNDFLSDEEYEYIYDLLKTIKATDNYSEYKVAFNKFCKFCSILPEHVIVTKYKLHHKKDGHNQLHVEYSNNNKKISLPENTKLFHITKVKGITALKPAFKGKSERGYLYDKPRIYFTIMKHMPSFLADYKFTDKLYKYQAKENITDVYVDPLVWFYAQGAVYIETNSEIPVIKV